MVHGSDVEARLHLESAIWHHGDPVNEVAEGVLDLVGLRATSSLAISANVAEANSVGPGPRVEHKVNVSRSLFNNEGTIDGLGNDLSR